MGRLTYGHSGQSIDIDDRTLAHLQIVIGTKLRRNEPLFFSWRDGSDSGGGRGTIWLSPAIELSFSYSSAAAQDINRRWLEALVLVANTPGGLQIIDEPVEETPSVVDAPSPVQAVTPEKPATLHAVG